MMFNVTVHTAVFPVSDTSEHLAHPGSVVYSKKKERNTNFCLCSADAAHKSLQSSHLSATRQIGVASQYVE